jgi:Spy/CpxP family protein refolding chaperone
MTASTGRSFPRLALGLLMLLGGICPAGAAQGQAPIPWWKSEQFQKDLGMTTDQVARVDAIFQATLPELRQRKDELDRLEAKLSRLIEADTDEATVSRQVDKTEGARGSLNKVRTLMLMRMRQVLTPDQRVRFKALHDRWARNRDQQDARRRNTPPPSNGR